MRRHRKRGGGIGLVLGDTDGKLSHRNSDRAATSGVIAKQAAEAFLRMDGRPIGYPAQSAMSDLIVIKAEIIGAIGLSGGHYYARDSNENPDIIY